MVKTDSNTVNGKLSQMFSEFFSSNFHGLEVVGIVTMSCGGGEDSDRRAVNDGLLGVPSTRDVNMRTFSCIAALSE